MAITNRRMRISPSGPFIVDPDSGAGPLPVGDGSPGIIQRHCGIENDPDLAMTGGDLLIDRWRTPLDPTTPTDTLPVTIDPGFLYDVELHAPLIFSAFPPGGAQTVKLSGINGDTAVREDFFSLSLSLPATANAPIHFDIPWRHCRFQVGVRYTAWQLVVNAPATTDLIVDLLTLRVTQYALGSF